MNGDNGPEKAGVMVPIPMYPLYSATITEYNGHIIGYYLDESKNWGLNWSELERSYNEASSKCKPRGLVVINPGNPTGQLLSKENMQQVIKFCHQKRLILLADEVYQENVHLTDEGFNSFKKVVTEMGHEYKDFELASFHSISKGYYGECGLRGGYVELFGFDPLVVQYLKKLQSTQLCSSTAGQVVMCCVVDPPSADMESYETFIKERTEILQTLKKKAQMVHESLNKIPGISCNLIQGAMYAFPQIYLPERAIEEAKKVGIQPDMFYCEQLLKKTGICFVPGSGFGQYPGTFHFRTTILPSVAEMTEIIEKLKVFHSEFLQEYQ